MSSQQVSENINELFDLVRKSEGIISTFEARSLESNPETVEDDYRRYARTHMSLGDTSEFEEDTYETVVGTDSPTKGYVYGKYGYGKTSTSVSIWHTLSQNDIIAVPPFTMDSFAAVMRATYGWMRYEFQNKAPGYIDELDEIHNQYLEQELKAVAKQKEDQYNLDFDRLVEMFEQMEQENELDLSINANTLIDFFNECTELALEADFDALVVIGDEFKEYWMSAENENDAESRFRQLTFGLESGAQIRDEFGLFISMPETTKSMLDSRAEDILNRFQKDNLTLNLQNVYGNDFPAELWDRYADQFGFDNKKHHIITKAALTAAGEVCSRNDLSNGPRTVMDIFRIALKQYKDHGETFTTLDLAEAFYEDEVRYQGSGTKIETAVSDALNHSAVDTEKKRRFLKLCAVFPKEGIPDSVVAKYGLEQAKTALSKKLHAEVIKVVADGYTLVDLTKTETIDPVRELIRDFWRDDYSLGHSSVADAVEAFANNLLSGEIFEPQRGTLDGWTNGGKDFNKLDHTVYQDQFDGTFDTRFPKRRMVISVSDGEEEYQIVGEHDSLGEHFGAPDLALNFVIRWQHSGKNAVDPHVRKESDREYTFVFNGKETLEELPSGLEFLRDAMDPNAVRPILMLALVNFLDDPRTELDAQQEQRVESFQQSLLDQTIKTLFDDRLISDAPFEIRRAGRRAVESVFTNGMESLYPDYHTVITSTQYRDVMEDYIDFLSTLDTTSKRRGADTVLEETDEDGSETGKKKMAKRLGLRRTSSFDGRLKKHYQDLLTIVNDDKDQYEVQADLHPLEEEILNRLEASEDDSLPVSEVNELALQQGYQEEEVEIITKIIQKRGIVVFDERKSKLILDETNVAIEDVEDVLDTCRKKVNAIEELDSNRVPDGSTEAIAELADEIERTSPENGEKLETLRVEAEHIADRLDEAGKLLYDHYESQCADIKREVERLRRNCIPNHLEDEVTSGVEFVGGLNDARTELLSKFRGIKSDLSELSDELKQAREGTDKASLSGARELHDRVESARDNIGEFEDEIDKFETHANELKQWRTFADRVGNTKSDIQDYSRTFDESIREEQEIEEFIGDIRERLAADPIEALTNREAFEERLEQIEQAYQERREERREVFNAKQDSLNDILGTATDGNAGRLRVTFDIKQPDKSRRRLLEEFTDEYQSQVLDRAKERLTSALNEVEYAQTVGIEADTDTEPGTVEERIEQAQATLRSLEGDLSRFKYGDIDDVTDVADNGRRLLETTEELQHEARVFRAQNDPDDENLQDLLDRIKKHRTVDFKELLMEYHEDGEDADVDDLLDAVVDLFKLNQIDIEIAERRGRR